MFLRRFTPFFLMLLAVTLHGCGENNTSGATVDYSPKGIPAKGDMYVSASLGEPSNLIPWMASDQPSHNVAGMIYNSLLKYDANLNLVGDLAERWDISPDGLTMTFHLRHGVKWADGTELTSDDVLTTFRTITDPKTLTPYSGDYMLVKAASAPDRYTFRVQYDKPFAPALASWAGLSVLPAPLLRKEKDINHADLARHPMGTGPYRLADWKAGREVIMTANPTYFEHEPWISKLRIRTIPDSDTQFLELKAGHLDEMGLTPLQYTRQTSTTAFVSRYAKYNYLGNSYVYLGFNLKNPLFADKRVRQALSYATPRGDLIRAVLQGQGMAIAAPFKPGTWAYNTALTPYPYDLSKARRLLAAAGWKDTDGDGVLDKGGKPFRFTIVTNQGNATRKMTAEILQYAFKQVGVTVEIQTQEWSTLVENTIGKRQFDALILGWSLSVEPDPYDIFYSGKTGPKEFNIISFSNKQADDMMVKARSTFDRAERKCYLDKFQEIIHDEQPYLFLYAPYDLSAIHKRVKGIVPAPAGLSYNFVDWYVPKGQQVYLGLAAMTAE